MPIILNEKEKQTVLDALEVYADYYNQPAKDLLKLLKNNPDCKV